MGYVSKDIAVITEPKRIALSSSPNFVVFESKPGTKTVLDLIIKVNINRTTPNAIGLSPLDLTDALGDVRRFRATASASDAGGPIYYLGNNASETAENLKEALLSDLWVATNFDVSVPSTWDGATLTAGREVHIRGKGSGVDFTFTLDKPFDNDGLAYTFNWIEDTPLNNDSLSGEASTAVVALDVYLLPGARLGEDDVPDTPEKVGQYLITLSKTYTGEPIWFELNALFRQYPGYNIPPGGAGWFDTGTALAYRFSAKVRARGYTVFYHSNALFAVSGFGRPSDTLDLDQYVLKDGTVKLLTNKPRTKYVRGQRAYLNYLKELTGIKTRLRIAYSAYSSSGVFLGVIHNLTAATDFTANTCQLDIDHVMDVYPNVGEVRVGLALGTVLVSDELVYEILPDCLHVLNDFSFLNRLGGWDNHNFDADTVDEIKTDVSTYNKTITPTFKLGEGVETVYATALDVTRTVEGAPVSDDVAEWLKELAASRVVLNSQGYYVIIEDFELRQSADTKGQHVPKVKYRLSEKYTNG